MYLFCLFCAFLYFFYLQWTMLHFHICRSNSNSGNSICIFVLFVSTLPCEKKMANHVPRIQTLISEGKLMLLWFEQLIVSTAFSASGKFVYYQQQFKHHWDYGHCVLLYGGRAGFPVAMVTGIVLVVGWNWLFIPFIWDLTTTKQCRWSYARVLLLIVDSFCF